MSDQPIPSANPAKVVVFSLGGTIASTKEPSKSGGVSPQLNAVDIVASVGDQSAVANVEGVSFLRVPSGDLTSEDMVALAKEIERTFEAGTEGVVVTQGTDTIEETAFLLDLLVRSPRPVVVTGAMRNPTAAGPDGPANLLAALRVATSRGASGLGTLVVMNDQIHAARFVRKTNTSNPGAFESPNNGPLGWIVEDRPRFVVSVPALMPIGQPRPGGLAPVALVRLALGDDDRVIRHVATLGFRGAVVEGFGGGHVPARIVDSLEALASVMPVVLASRTGSGELLRETYGFPGSERDVLNRGLISAGWLDGLKSKILLSLILSEEPVVAAVRDRFDAFIASMAPGGDSNDQPDRTRR